MLLSRKLLFYQNQFPREYFTPGSYLSTMIPGTYEIIIRGAGGAGGANGGASNAGSGGIGGAGSSGSLTRVILSVQNITTATVYVGEKGTLSGDNYNGGTGGAGGSGGAGGKGGGGGKPSYILINNSLFDAESGSGGGGGGGCGGDGRNADGGGGGGGGGRYKIQRATYSVTAKRNIQLTWDTVDGNNIIKEVTDPSSGGIGIEIQTGEELYVGKTWTIPFVILDSNYGDYTYTIDDILPNGDAIFSSYRNFDNTAFGPSTISNVWTNDIILKSIAGKNGASYNNGGAGINGTAGNTAEFPNVYSGGGGAGYGHGGSSGANGGGASGGSGGDAGNHSGRSAGSGGGGAGGDTNAGGGTSGSSRPGGSGSNYNATPVDTTSENALYGITGDYGTGGTTATEGKSGFVVIRQIFVISEIINLGLVQITSVPSITDNAGDITGTIEESDDAGAITGSVEDTDSAGSIYEQIPATSIWNLGSITDSVTETKNCGSII